MGLEVTAIPLALLAGIVGVLSPCVWPLVPVVMSSAAVSGRSGPLWLAGGMSLSFAVAGTALTFVLVQAGLDPELFRYVAAVVLIAAAGVILVPYLNDLASRSLSSGVARMGLGEAGAGGRHRQLTGESVRDGSPPGGGTASMRGSHPGGGHRPGLHGPEHVHGLRGHAHLRGGHRGGAPCGRNRFRVGPPTLERRRASQWRVGEARPRGDPPVSGRGGAHGRRQMGGNPGGGSSSRLGLHDLTGSSCAAPVNGLAAPRTACRPGAG